MPDDDPDGGPPRSDDEAPERGLWGMDLTHQHVVVSMLITGFSFIAALLIVLALIAVITRL
jgi:hypothetical protein